MKGQIKLRFSEDITTLAQTLLYNDYNVQISHLLETDEDGVEVQYYILSYDEAPKESLLKYQRPIYHAGRNHR